MRPFMIFNRANGRDVIINVREVVSAEQHNDRHTVINMTNGDKHQLLGDVGEIVGRMSRFWEDDLTN